MYISLFFLPLLSLSHLHINSLNYSHTFSLPLSFPVTLPPSSTQVPHQMGTLAYYRYEQPIVDYCQAHQPLRLNMGYEGPPQGLEELGPRERATIQTVALPTVPSATMGVRARPRSPPSILRVPSEGTGGPFPPPERTTTLTFGR